MDRWRILRSGDELFVLHPALGAQRARRVSAQWAAAQRRRAVASKTAGVLAGLALLGCGAGAGALMGPRAVFVAPVVVVLSVVVAVLTTREVFSAWRPDARVARPLRAEDRAAVRAVIAGGAGARRAHEELWRVAGTRVGAAGAGDRLVVSHPAAGASASVAAVQGAPGGGGAVGAPVDLTA